MNTFVAIACIVLVVLLVSLPTELRIRKALQNYWSRSCTGKSWKHQFPKASKKDIRNFLFLFVDAFAFSRKKKLHFEPDDKVLEIYHSLYPSKWIADAMELETLSLDLKRTYRIDLSSIWRDDITLGEIFRYTGRAQQDAAANP